MNLFRKLEDNLHRHFGAIKTQENKPQTNQTKTIFDHCEDNVGTHFEHPVTQKNVVTKGSMKHHFIIIKFRQRKKLKTMRNCKPFRYSASLIVRDGKCTYVYWRLKDLFCWLQHFELPELCAASLYYGINKCLLNS